ncbi:MAG: TetR/AcrR family transcriptional regulator [Minwuia sp.]|nr:TetR/AcrR family transcriptional regulator [Minwuia sp.]
MSWLDGNTSNGTDDAPAGRQAPTRDRLIRAFMHLVQQRGYAAVGTAEILKAATAPRGSLYHHFPTGKSGLAVAAIADLTDDIVYALHHAAGSKRNLGKLLNQMAAARAGWLRQTNWSEGPLFTVLTHEAVPHEPDIAAALIAASEAVTGAFADLFVTHGFTPDIARRHAQLARATLDGAMTLSRAARSSEALTEAGTFLALHLSKPDSSGTRS